MTIVKDYLHTVRDRFKKKEAFIRFESLPGEQIQVDWGHFGSLPMGIRSLRRFVRDNVQRGAEVRTDGWSGYIGIELMGYKHTATNIANTGDPAHVVMPRVHRIASLLNRWWLGIHHGAIRPSHLDYYLDEFTFRFNRRTSRARGLLFYRLMEQAVDCRPVPRKMIRGGQSQYMVCG